jgi:hypothetical protein
MDKELEHMGTWIQKHAKYLIIIAFVFLLVETPLGMSILGIVNPGFPGAESACYGVNFKDFGSDWQGTNTIHVLSNAETELASHVSTTSGYSDNVYWGAGNGPESMTVVHDFHDNLLGGIKENQIATEVQTNIPLASFNYQNSTPLVFSNVSTWDQGEILQYWNTQASTPTNQTLSNGTRVSSVTYTATSQSLLLIPGNFYLSIYLPASNNNPGTASGWQEGTWNQVDFWYAIYWYEWLNAYGPILQANEASPNIPANALNRQEQFNLRGGFPIQGWIQNYQIPMTTKNGQVYDLYQFDTRGSAGDNTLASSQLPTKIAQNILALVQPAPSLNGRSITLYTQPGDQYQLPTYTLPSGPIDAQAQGLLQSPDWQTTLPTEYFKIGIQTLGTYPDNDFWTGAWTVYYPTVDYLLRFIFGVYGIHTFVWTVQTALALGYNGTGNYQAPPAQWENRTVITANTQTPLSSLADLFANPFFALQFYFIVIVIFLLIVTVLNPGVWSVVFQRRKDR